MLNLIRKKMSNMGKISFQEAMKKYKLQDYDDIAYEYEKIINLGIERYWDNLCCCEEEDKSNVFDEEAEMLNLFKYRIKLLILCCLCETWEQDLYCFLQERNFINTDDLKQIKYSNFCEAYEKSMNNKISNYNIENVRNIVNVIKHGNGCSLKKIVENNNYGLNEKYIKYDYHSFDDYLNKYSINFLRDSILELDGIIKDFNSSIKRFWIDTYDIDRDR